MTDRKSDTRLADRRDAPAEPASPVSYGSVQAISTMIKDLEVQLDRMLAVNANLDKELEQERARRVEAKRHADQLAAQLRRAQEDTAASEDLLAEVAHLKAERARLADSGQELERSLAEAEIERQSHERELARAKEARDEALEELESVEAQFDRAMQLVTDYKTRLAVLGEEYDALRGRLKMMEESQAQVQQERDALLSDLDESRAALEEIRRSLVDACVVAQYRGPADGSE